MTPPNNQPREFWILDEPVKNPCCVRTRPVLNLKPEYEIIHVREVLNQYTTQDVVNFISNEAGNYCSCESVKPIFGCYKHTLTDLCGEIEKRFLVKSEILPTAEHAASDAVEEAYQKWSADKFITFDQVLNTGPKEIFYAGYEAKNGR